ncbi:neurogenic locus protein delta-like [Ptychodera flava]|uniref:neurogenic locus protein delta-like n=1 Tax=Ptychodera flava TaxID=63121 RepID=UPI00396AA322
MATRRGPLRLYSINAETNEPGTVELSIIVENWEWYGNVVYEVSYWMESNTNDTVTLTTYSRSVTLANLTTNETYSILVAMRYVGLTETIEMNYTDPCIILPCQHYGSCIGLVVQYYNGDYNEGWNCQCLDGIYGSSCEYAARRLDVVKIHSPDRGMVELTFDLDYRWLSYDIEYEVTYWRHSDVNDSQTVTAYSQPVTLMNLTSPETYSISVALMYVGFRETFIMNYTDPCIIHLCQNEGSCTSDVVQYYNGGYSEEWECHCLYAFYGSYCQRGRNYCLAKTN